MSKATVAQAVLTAAKTVDSNACIAGGYARDTLLGVEPRDVDVYVGFTPILQGTEREQLRELSGAVAWRLRVAGFDVADLGHEIRRAYGNGFARGPRRRPQTNVVKLSVDGVAVDLVAVRESGLNHVWRAFDIGLCMAGITDPETMEIQTDPAHDKDAADKTLTLRFDQVPEDDRRSNAFEHVQRLLKKYEGFEVKVVM